MTDIEFWQLIENSAIVSDDDESQIDRLTQSLIALGEPEIISFCNHLYAAINSANRWDIRAAAFIINNGCSDDFFDYFVGWLISRGRLLFTRFLESPEDAGLEIQLGTECQCEEIRYVAEVAFEGVGGDPDDLYDQVQPLTTEMIGSQWNELEVYGLYPRLAKKFKQ